MSKYDKMSDAEIFASLDDEFGGLSPIGDVWVCMPPKASDEDLQKLVEQLIATSDPASKVYVEFANEDTSGWLEEFGTGDDEPDPPSHPLQRITAMPSTFGQSMWRPWEL
jgi:hypothetical protein